MLNRRSAATSVLLALLALIAAACGSGGAGHAIPRSTLAPAPVDIGSTPASGGTAIPGNGGHSTGSGVPPAAPSGGAQQASLRVGSDIRSVLLERPTPGAHRRPLIIFLHGAQSSGQRISSELSLSAMASDAGVLVAYPDGDPSTRSWRVGCCNAYATSSAADFDFIAALIDSLVADGEADPNRVVLAGFSSGALFVNAFGCRMAGKVSAIVSVAGSLLEPPTFVPAPAPRAERCSPARPVSVYEVHGTADTVVPPAGSTRGCSGSCGPGVKGFLAPTATVSDWWRKMDGCAAPIIRISAKATTSLAACAHGTTVGLALVNGATHDIPQLRSDFPLRATLIALALGQPPSGW